MANGRLGHAVIHLALQQNQFGLRQPRLGVEHKIVGLGAKLEFALLRCQRLLRKFEGYRARDQCLSRFIQLLDGVADFARDLFANLPTGI